MPKLMHNHRLMIWLLVACLLLPACGIFAVDEAAPSLSDDLPAVQEQAKPALEAGAEALPTLPAGSTELLPVIVIGGADTAECLSPESQTMGSSIAANFETTYEQVMGWYCAGHGFEDILLALQTADGLEVMPQALLDRLEQGQTWEEIWKELGLLK
jgi:hypothetical protein